VGITFSSNYGNQFTKPHTNGNVALPDKLDENYSWGINPLLEQTLTFNKSFGEHDLTLLAGMSSSRYGNGRSITVSGNNFPNMELDNIMLAGNKSIQNEIIWQTAALSYFTRLNYGYANKYLLTGIFRSDASPNFAPQNRWGNFPALSVGWKLHEENFIKDNLSGISNLKLRLGWGVNGISNIGSYQYLSFTHSRGMSYPVGLPGAEKYLIGTTIKALASPDIQWEEATTVNVGLDFGLIENRLSVTMDYFNKKTDKILVSVPTAPSMGLGLAGGSQGGNRIANAASATNNGFEFSAIYSSNYENEFKYNLSANFTYISNEVTALGEGEPIQGPSYNGQAAITLTDIGHPIGAFYGFKVDKVYSSQSEIDADNELAKKGGASYYQSSETKPGDIRFKDLDGNGYVDNKDRDYIGNPIPKYSYGLSFDASYKGWDFATNFSGIYDVDIYSAFYTWALEGMRLTGNHSTYVRNRWTPTNTNTDVPRAVSSDPSNNLRTSDRYINNGSYLKVKNLSIGYTLPSSLLNSIHLNTVSKFRIYASAQDLLTVTSYKKGYDPEVSAINPEDLNGYNLGRGIDDGFVPHPRTYLFGIEINF
jgi:TonB-linked SusC/RagA family outer membrane protein